MPENIDDVLSDPEFHQQPLADKLNVLRTYPEFSALSPKDQGGLLAHAQQKVVGTTDAINNAQPKDPGLWSTLGHDAAALPGAIVKTAVDVGKYATNPVGAAFDPTNAVNQTAQAQADQFKKAGQDFSKGGVGNIVSGTGHALAGALPLAGPAAAQAGEELGSGQYGAGAAHSLELLAPSALSALGPRAVRIPRTVTNVNNPVEEQALASVAPKVRMTPGQRAGQVGLQSSERNLRNMPGTSTEAEQFYRGAQDDLATEGNARIAQQGQVPGATPQTTNAYGAGQAIQQTLTDRVNALKQYADRLYDSTRQTTARNVKQVQVGTKMVPGPNPLATLTPAGMPRKVPVMSDLESPVALDPIRKQLQPVYDELASNLAPAKQAYSPAFTALKNLMDRKDIVQMNAMDFDRFLGAVKSITRDGSSNILSTQSQRLARQVIAAGENEFQNAISGAGPNVISKLQNARRAVREYHETADFLGDLRSEPGSLYSNLTTGGDRIQNTLNALRSKAPKAVDTVGRTYLGEMMDKATREGGWSRSEGVKADWDRLGPQTKNTLFGPQVTQSMNDFLLAAKRLTPAVGSPTADRLSALVAYGDVGTALAEFVGGTIAGHPVIGAVGAAGTLAKTRLQPAILAKLSFKPAGAELLKQALTVPVNSPAFNNTMGALNAMAKQESGGQANPYR